MILQEALVVAYKELNHPELLNEFDKDFKIQLPLRDVTLDYGSNVSLQTNIQYM